MALLQFFQPGSTFCLMDGLVLWLGKDSLADDSTASNILLIISSASSQWIGSFHFTFGQKMGFVVPVVYNQAQFRKIASHLVMPSSRMVFHTRNKLFLFQTNMLKFYPTIYWTMVGRIIWWVQYSSIRNTQLFTPEEMLQCWKMWTILILSFWIFP